MTGETLKALLMIAMFGMLEMVLRFSKTATLRHSLDQAADRLWHALPLPHHRLELVPVRHRHRKG